LDLVEIIVLLAIALVVLGPERLPDVMRTVGKVMRELRTASNTVMRELTDVLEEQPPSIRPARPALPETTKSTEPTEKT
jgi:Tat protein translocase TatB subunit